MENKIKECEGMSCLKDCNLYKNMELKEISFSPKLKALLRDVIGNTITPLALVKSEGEFKSIILKEREQFEFCLRLRDLMMADGKEIEAKLNDIELKEGTTENIRSIKNYLANSSSKT